MKFRQWILQKYRYTWCANFRNTMEGLYRLDKDNKPIPAVAESSTKSEDGKNIHLNYGKMQSGQTAML